MKRIVLIVAVALALAPPRVFAQAVVNTVVGSPEVIAIAVDHASGTTYFATDRPGAIYRIPVNGSPSLLAGVAGGRTDDGAAAGQSAVFPGHNGLAVDAGGNVYFSEPSLHRIRQIDGTGTITTIAGSGSVSQVNPRNIFGGFSIHTDLPAPTALAFNPVTGDLFAADETWDIVVQITANGATLSRSTARTFLAIGGDPNSASIFLDFYWYNAFGYSGDGGAAIDAKLNHPRGLAFDALGNLFIADTGNHVVRRVDTSGTITTFAGSGTPGSSGDGGAAANARLFMPTGVFVTAAGDLAIADTSNHRVRLVDFHSGVISTVAGTGSAGHAGDNSAATAATLAYPLGVAQTVSGALLIADSQNNRVRSVSQSVITTLAQTGTDYSGNGAPGGNAVNQPLGVGFDKSGNLFFTDTGNARVRRVDAATRAVTTVVGSGVPGYGGDGGPAVNAMLNCPTALTFDKNGVLFVADGCANTVRRVVPGVDGLVTGAADEIITTYAGTGARYGAGDGAFGPATAARLANPAGLAIDSTGTLYIGELDAFEIRTVDSGGTISGQMGELFPTGLVIDPKYDALIVANGEESDLECGGYQIVRQGNIGLPVGAGGSALDALARLYLSDDRSLQSVYRLTFTGGDICDGTQEGLQVSFVAGTGQGVIGYSGDGGLATAATFNSPEGVAIDPAGNLVVADAGNNVIRRVQQPSVIVGVDVSSIDFGIRGLLAASPSTVVTATATGSAAATFTAATLSGANPGDFIITSDGCVGAVVAVGATCQVKVSFRPTALGPRTATLQINDNASGAPQLVSLTGVGASLTVAPLTISFASQTVGIASAPTSVTVTNGTATTTTVLSLGFSGANANDFATLSDTCTGTVLTAQMSCTFGVTFAPQDVGPRAATLNVSSTAADSPQAIGLSGTGIPAFPAVQLAPASIAFPATTVGSTSTNVALTVNSTGTAPLVLNSLTLSGNQASDFTIAGGTCVVPQSIAPGQSCTALITFAPQAACNSTASLSVADNAPGSPQTVALTGLGLNSPEAPFTTALFCTSHAAQPHEMAAAPDGRVWFDEGGSAFAPPALANVSATQGVKENPAAIDPSDKITGLAFAPDSSHAYLESQLNVGNWVSLVNPAGVKVKSPTAFPFSVIAGPDYGLWEAHDYSCGDSALATDFSPNGKTSDYTPTAAWIYANASQHFCVNTSSIAPGPDGTMWFGITASSGGVNATHATSPNGFIRVAPDGTFVDFTPDVQTTSTALGSDGNFYALFQTIGACNIEKIDAAGNRTTITLDYNVAVPNCQTIVAGPDKRLWMVGNTPGFVSALIAWDPATGAISTYPAPATLYLTAGPDEGIWFDALPSAVGRLDIGGGPSRGFLMPQIVSFQGPTGGATSAAKTVTLYSTGTAPLDITSVTVGGAEPAQFVIQDDCGGKSIAPGASCTVVVASRSTKPGNHLATLVINDNDVFSPQTVPLTEFTNPPSPSVAPPSLSFPTTNVGQQSASAKLTLLNPTDRL
ncbi:MAG TPA: choice-of-anchor D domain-containing protein, partial [Vicinamibacterales bacterium]